MNKKTGFTLIELMVVILILSILFSVFLPRLVLMRYRSQVTACTLYERNIATALETYQNDYQPKYPSSLNLLYTNQYINAIPNCPSDSSPYQYNINGSSDYYTLWCQGTHYMVLVNTVNQGYPQYTPGRGIKLK